MKLILPLLCIIGILDAQLTDLKNNSPISILASIEHPKEKGNLNLEDFNPKWIDSLKLSFPCDGIPVPKRTMRLPNAPRDYRSGIHRGIDFFANWGTPVKAVADGIIIRADQHYEEVPADFRENLLKASAQIGNTPSDIFNSVLLGKAVFLDHGFDLVPGFRTISIYAHLSHIENDLRAGSQVKEGQLIGRSGNTGMRESTLGSRAGSHLHWEMILQSGDKEIYLGKGVSNPELYEMLSKIFVQ